MGSRTKYCGSESQLAVSDRGCKNKANFFVSHIYCSVRIGCYSKAKYQQYTTLDSYKAANKSLEGIPLKDHPLFKGKKAIDIEKMPGYEVLIGNIWFGAAWKMWFSDSYYDFISKDSIKNFSECYSNEQIADTCRCITLYENISDYDAPQSREKQWKFKEAIDFQNTVNRLKKSGILYDNDPHIEIENGSFNHGGMKLFKLYQDIEGNSIVKSKAAKVKMLEYNRAGKIVWEEQEKL